MTRRTKINGLLHRLIKLLRGKKGDAVDFKCTADVTRQSNRGCGLNVGQVNNNIEIMFAE